jgi:GMP synthase-like glutamine amidotransferase
MTVSKFENTGDAAETPPVKVALIDMYEGTPNLGMRNLRRIINQFKPEVQLEVFDVRSKIQVPDLSHDIYIFSGGPGNPLVGDEAWLKPFHNLIDQLWNHNKQEGAARKFAFFICHSFQMACHHFGIGSITRRREKSFGIFPVYKTEEGKKEWLFAELPNSFWVGDFREFQVVDPNFDRMAELGIKLLCIEKERDRPELPRAMMAVRFSEEMVGTQFHPEADPAGMRIYFFEEDRIKAVIDEYGAEAYFKMVERLKDPDKLDRTYKLVLPLFLYRSIRELRKRAVVHNN